MDAALATAGNPTAPSYGYMVSNEGEPSTTLWENWYADQLVDDQDDSSRNHIMFGTISAFFWKYIVGVTSLSPGWTSIKVAPEFGERCNVTTAVAPPSKRWLSTVSATLGTASGTLSVHWKLGETMAELNTTLPSKVDSVEVWVPCVMASSIVQVAGVVVWRDGEFVHSASPCVQHAERASVPGASVRFVMQPSSACANLAFRRVLQ